MDSKHTKANIIFKNLARQDFHELHLLCFTPSSGNISKLQLHFVEIIEMQLQLGITIRPTPWPFLIHLCVYV